jgi:putative ABC transport system permease protein
MHVPLELTTQCNRVGPPPGRADPLLPVGPETTMASIMREASAESRLLLTLVGVFTAVALLLVALGVHGVIAQSVTDRRREFGVRLALGATPARTVRGVALSGAALAATGAALGGVLALLAVGLVRSFLWGVSEHDVATYAVATMSVVGVAALASLVPSLRILRLDPAETLRE